MTDTKLAVPDYGIPHVSFSPTHDGFIVNFRRASRAWLWIGTICIVLSLIACFVGYFILGGLTGFVLAAVTIAICIFVGAKTFSKTSIIVNGNNVTIDKKKMSRDSFAHFHIFEYGQSYPDPFPICPFLTLGYSFGNKSFPIRGLFLDTKEVTEVLAGLNGHLRNTPRAGAAYISPDTLRAARPTDF